MKMIYWSAVILALAMATHSVARADSADAIQRQDSIRAAAEAFLQQHMNSSQGGRSEINVGQLDNRLRLKACDSALDTFMPAGSRLNGRTTVGVRCAAPTPWTVYVNARIQLFDKVLVSRKPMPRGTVLDADDLQLMERDVMGLNYGYFQDGQEASGKRLKRALRAGAVLTPAMLDVPQLVRRGDQVLVVAETGGIKVRMNGKAISDGGAGDRVRVKTSGANREVEGTVVGQGVIKVTL